MNYKISIEGDYWDSFIYRGRLYLWTMNCSIMCIDWQRLVNFYSKKMNFDLFASYLTWIDGNYLYKQNLNYLFKDSEFKQYLINKLNKNKKEIYLSKKELSPFLLYEKDCPNRILPIDIEVYNNHLYCMANS